MGKIKMGILQFVKSVKKALALKDIAELKVQWHNGRRAPKVNTVAGVVFFYDGSTPDVEMSKCFNFDTAIAADYTLAEICDHVMSECEILLKAEARTRNCHVSSVNINGPHVHVRGSVEIPKRQAC